MLTLVQIDPKRAIPRDEQEKTSKIFVGGVSQEATEQDFKQFFMQFGRVVDATLMIDKDTGRPRGFGFVTFDSEAAVEATLSRPLEILGKPIEVKKAQPRGNMRDDDGGRGRRGRMDNQGMGPDNSQQQVGGQGAGGMPSGISPQMMAQYWQRMQQYFSIMQQQMAAAAATQGQGMGGMNMAGMNPAMMQQMKQMQQMGGQQGGQSPSPGPQGVQNMMNPAMMQQMQQMQQMQNQGQQQMSMGGAAGYSANRGGPGYNAHEQLAFEQQKYEQQQARRVVDNRAYSPYQQGGPTSWEGMYDEVPQPNIPSGPQGRGGGGMGRGAIPSQGSDDNSPQPASAAPANAPTGPRNAGRTGPNYRGGGRGGGHRGFHPYSR
jgi:RNA-binding protein Musashi